MQKVREHARYAQLEATGVKFQVLLDQAVRTQLLGWHTKVFAGNPISIEDYFLGSIKFSIAGFFAVPSVRRTENM